MIYLPPKRRESTHRTVSGFYFCAMQRAGMKTTRTNVEPTYPAPRCARAVVARRPPAARTLQHAPTLDCRLPSFIYEFVRQSHGVRSPSIYCRGAFGGPSSELALPPAWRSRSAPAPSDTSTTVTHPARPVCGTHPAPFKPSHPSLTPSVTPRPASRALMRVGLLVCAGPAKPIPPRV